MNDGDLSDEWEDDDDVGYRRVIVSQEGESRLGARFCG